MLSSLLPFAATAILLASNVAAHGYTDGVTIRGNYWRGLNGQDHSKPGDSAVLVTDYLLPLYDVWDSAIACGWNPQNPNAVADIGPGEKFTWNWQTNPGDPWTHPSSTHRTFIASCQGDCKDVTGRLGSLVWFELDQQYIDGTRVWSGEWAAASINRGGTWSDTLPAVPNGQYLIRQEIGAVHFSAYKYEDNVGGHNGGTEFYPTCIAVNVQGSDGSWNPGQGVNFPGAYDRNEPGHYNPNWATDPGSVPLAGLQRFTGNPGGGGSSGGSSGSSGSSGNSSGGSGGGSSGGDGSYQAAGASNPSSSSSANASSTATSAAASASPSKHVCKRGMRRSKARKMVRSAKHRRTEH